MHLASNKCKCKYKYKYKYKRMYKIKWRYEFKCRHEAFVTMKRIWMTTGKDMVNKWNHISIILKLWTEQWLKKTSLCRRLPRCSGPSDVLWGHNSHGKESQEFEPERLSRYADFICMGGIMIQMAIMMKRIMITMIMTCLFAKDWLIASQRWISPDSLSTHSRGLDTSRTWFNILFSFLS